MFCWLEYTVATTVNVSLPSSAQTNSTVLRWRKTNNSSLDVDVWAIDHISIPHSGVKMPQSTGKATVIFSENFDRIPTIG